MRGRHLRIGATYRIAALREGSRDDSQQCNNPVRGTHMREKHFRVKHKENQLAVRSNHINGIEAFWSFAKRRLSKFNGIHHHTFYLHLKECEFRFNHRNQDLYAVLLGLLRENPL